MNLKRPERILIGLCIALLSSASVPAQIRLAALGGVQSTDLIQKNSIPGYDTTTGRYFSTNTEFELGVLAEIPLGTHNLYFQPGILYSAKGNQYSKSYDTSSVASDTLYDQHTLNLNYVEIPLYMTWKLPISKDHKSQIYFSAGPYFAFIYGVSQSYQNRIKDFNTQQYIYNSGTEDLQVGDGPQKFKTLDIGITAKAGFELGNVLLGAYFSHGFSNSYTANYPSSFHNQVFGGSLGIWLNKVKPPPQPPMDSDQDGTPDVDDSCKTIAGVPRYHGCPIPDTDHDGINDEEDSCRTIAGVLRYHGCPIPDTDLDGVNDEEDSCKTVPGPAKYHGCPIPDTDHDGLNDEEDKCPLQAGPRENQGCPVIKPELRLRAALMASDVRFTMNSTKLTKSSYPAIQEIADSLKSNPDTDLLIEGHTDNTGSPAYNQKLSSDRANAIKKAILARGIPENRIQVKAFGETLPVADNKTSAGRAKNRRVVFVFHLKNS